ncbi:MAG: energy transducer TonB [Zetaproteobacteria bacterium]|nr:MAG: energy transducer TonB [Zetaproteobacteria bacterium]
MMRGYALRLFAVTASLALHGLLFVQAGGAWNMANTKKNLPMMVARLSFAPPTPVVPPKPETEPAPEATQAKPEPVRKRVRKPHRPRKVANTRKRTSPHPRPEPAPKREKRVLASSPPAQQVARAPAATNIPAIDPGVIARERQRYLAKIKHIIEAHKRYPNVARRRRMTGDVRIRFELLASGEVRHVSTEGGCRILQHAAMATVREVLPLPPPPPFFRTPWRGELVMRYRLR